MNVTVATTPIEILLVEDNLADVRLTEWGLKQCTVSSSLSVVGDGVEALAFLRRVDQHASAPRPALVLLDLNLPRKDGRQVLAEMKQDPDLKRIPVVILTTSQDPDDILRTYNLHANCFVTKPAGLDDFMAVVRAIEEFWLTTAKLPKE